VYKDKKIILFAFATSDLVRSINRLNKQAIHSNYYDEIKILNPENFDHPMKEKYKILKKNGETRGYGYWFWKPIFLLKILNQLNKGDIVHYVDIGCHIQKKNSRFKDYIEILIKNDTWILPFQYYVDSNFSKDIFFVNRFEYQYTKADLLDYFGFLKNKRITHTPQFWAGSFFLKNCEESKNFLKEWIGIFEKKFELINDSSSIKENFEGFIENRHDQSVFSLLCKKYSITGLSAYECEWGEKRDNRTWEHNFNNPILAKRDLKFNIIKRFVNRQIKNWNRIKRKIFNN
tara:strand:- start:48 stop:914 length:867 start_codon:yes stop_codon:yes gene_type:complete